MPRALLTTHSKRVNPSFSFPHSADTTETDPSRAKNAKIDVDCVLHIQCIYIDYAVNGMEKNAQFAFRVESSLRDQFVRTCKKMDRPAGQVLREFMREFVGENIQPSLFDEVTDSQKNTTAENRENK